MKSDLLEGFAKTGKTQICAMQVDGPDISKYGVLKKHPQSGAVLGLVEKPIFEDRPSNLASIGRYVLTPDIFDILRGQTAGTGGEVQLADAINEQAAGGGVEEVLLQVRESYSK